MKRETEDSAVTHPRPRRTLGRGHRFLACGLTLLLGGALSFVMFALVHSREMSHRQMEFKNRAQERTDAIENAFRIAIQQLQSVAVFHAASQSVSREEFRTFVASIAGPQSLVESIAWVPQESPTYFPVRYQEPRNGHHLTLDSNYALDPVRREAMTQASESGLPTATPVFEATHEGASEPHRDLLICVPVYNAIVQAAPPEERARSLRGFIVAEIDCTELIEAPLRSLKPSGIDLVFLNDSPGLPDSRVIYQHHSRTRPSGTARTTQETLPSELQAYSTFVAAQRPWTLEATPAPAFLAHHQARTAWAVLAGSLLLTFLTAAFLWHTAQTNEALHGANERLSREIDERRGIETRLLVHEQAIAAASNGIVITDARQPDLPIIYANPAFTRMTGYSREEALGRNCRFLQLASDPSTTAGNTAALLVVRDALRLQQNCDVILRNRRKDGTPFWNHLIISPVRDAHGIVTHFIGIQADITARKDAEDALMQARRDLEERVAARTRELSQINAALSRQIEEYTQVQDALRQAEAKYRGIFDNAPIGIYQSTPEGRYVSVNAALARMYAYTSAEDLLNKVGDIGSEIYVDPRFRADFKRLMAEHGQAQGLEYQVRRRDGGVIWVSETARVVTDRKGNPLYYEGTVQDVTARRNAEAEKARLEQQLRQAQKMEAIGTLAGGIAHDFNNILNAILGFTELVADDVPPDSLAARNLREVIKGSHRARDLVRQILAFSRQGEANRDSVSLGGIIDEVFKLVSATLPGSVRLEKQMLAAADRVIGDTTQIHQVLMNLCTNAIHAMNRTGGALTVSVLEYIASQTPDNGPVPNLGRGSYRLLRVTDTGHGMERQILERIFDPFFTTKPVGQGTGLGLAVVHGIIKHHGGDITVTSEPGVGTSFNVYLPEAIDAITSHQTEVRPISGGTERILVVDDEETIADMMQQKLARLGYQVVSHRDSLAALKEFQNAPRQFDVVITDYSMPSLNGAELAREMVRFRADIPIILCTGYSPPDLSATPADAAIFHDCILKPVNFGELGQAVRRALEPRQP